MAKIMNFFIYILCVAFPNAVFANKLKIIPNVPELTLTSGANYVIKCQGTLSVKWNITNTTTNGNSSIQTGPTYAVNNQKFVSHLILTGTIPEYVGYYSCIPSFVNQPVDTIISEKIYLFERSATQLLLNVTSSKVTRDEFGDIIIPCRPTSPEINMTLKKNNILVTSGFKYDPKIGYIFILPSIQIAGSYHCMADRYNINNGSQTFTVDVNSHGIKKAYTVIQSNPITVFKNSNISVSCSVDVDGKIFTLNWIIFPNKKKLQNGDGNFFLQKTSGTNNIKQNLEIRNITLEDEGEYICEVLAPSGHTKRETYTLNIFRITPENTDINVTVQDGQYSIIREAGFNKIEWKVNVSPNDTKLEWKYPNGSIIEYNNLLRVHTENGPNNSSSTLVIRDLQMWDSGVYEMSAIYSKNNYKKKAVSLLVQSKPEFKNSIKNKNVFYEVNKKHNIECYVNGYPLPEVSWAFKDCENTSNCETTSNFVTLSKNMHSDQILNEAKVVSILNFIATKPGKLLCNASNDFGSSSYVSTFLLTDLVNNFNGMAINGPPIILIGDTVTIKCGVDKYNYFNNISWFYQPLNHTHSFKIDSLNQKYNIESNISTIYSYYSYMTISNISHLFNGEYICKVSKKFQSNIVKISYPLMVRKPYIPRLYEYSNATYVNLTDSVTLKCKFRGLPEPTITWFHNNLQLQTNQNNTKIMIENKNQTLHIRNISVDDFGSYKCIALNRMGNSSKVIELAHLTARNSTSIINSSKQVDNKMQYILYLVFFISLVLLLYIIFSLENFVKNKRKLDAFRKGALHSFNPELGIEEQANLLPYDKSFEFPKNKIKLGIQLGSGAFGVVYKAEAIDIIEKNVTSIIAVKMIKPGSESSNVNALISELKIMIHIGQHVNIVNLLGAYTGNISEKLMVLVEYCRFGNIRDYMLRQKNCFVNQVTADGRLNYNYKMKSFAHNPYYEYDPNKKNPYYENDADKKVPEKKIEEFGGDIGDDGYLLTVDTDELESRYYYQGDYEKDKTRELCTHDLFCWSFQVARGMQYLATKKILHGDLATRNILLADNNIVKICDFGFSKTMYNSENYKKKSDGPLPMKWMAIESLQEQIFSTQSDVWAFGIVLWEMFSLGGLPYPGIHARDLLIKLKDGYRMEIPKYANPDIYNIMLECWKEEPMTRPLFSDLVEYLGNLLQDDKRAFYISLDDIYEKKNNKELNSKCVLNILSDPTYINSKTMNVPSTSSNYIETSVAQDLKMKEL